MDPISVTWENRPGVPPALTVTQLARIIRDTVRANPILSRILVRGEVSNLQPAPSGHVFFTLKDATAPRSGAGGPRSRTSSPARPWSKDPKHLPACAAPSQ